MTTTQFGVATAAVLALVWIVLGFWQFVLVGVAMLIGAGIGRILSGKLDLSALLDVVTGRRRSR